MTESVLKPSIAPLSPTIQIRRLVWKIAIATFLLMAVGSATRVMNAGLACPDWPLCYGQFLPFEQMNLRVFLEWFHRLDAAVVGFSAIALAGLSWWWRRELPQWVPYAATLAFASILVQGLLGGLTVTELLRFDIVTAHLGSALFFFCVLLVMGTSLIPHEATGTGKYLSTLGWTAAIAIYLQSLLGALVASQWALHQCLWGSRLCAVMNSHLIGVVPATLATLTAIVVAWRTPALHPALRLLANVAALLVMLQILVGLSTYRFHLQIELLTISHQAIGAALLGVLVMFAVLARRNIQPTRDAR
ncbi:MAG: heme A synthase [Cyanobacteria bacterium P01_E01_bin.42]